MTGQQPSEVAERWDGSGLLRRYLAHLVAEIEIAGSFAEAPNHAFAARRLPHWRQPLPSPDRHDRAGHAAGPFP